MTIKIEKGVPLLSAKSGRPPIYPWTEMEVGDSFWAAASQNAIKVGACREKRNTGKIYKTKVEDGGTRCWRIA